MAGQKFNIHHKEVLDSFLLEIPVVQPGKMFGYPAYYVGGKLFACVYEDAVGLKVPEEVAKKALSRGDIVPFQPLGRRVMKEWIQINHTNSQKYTEDTKLFDTSIEYVSTLAQMKVKKTKG